MKKEVRFTFLGIILFLGIYLIFFIPNAKSNPDTGITNCSNLTTSGEYYFLSNDVLNNQFGSKCISIFSPNVVFDCKGHYIYSIQNQTGIYANATNVTVKNCNITIGGGGNGNAYNIYFNGVNNGTIFNNSLFGEGYYGILISAGSNNNLTLNTGVSNFSVLPFIITSSSNNILMFNKETSSSNAAIKVVFSTNTTLISNIGISNSQAPGIFFQTVSNSTLINNTAISNSNPGIWLDTVLNSVLINNTAISNSSVGIIVGAFANNNTLINNTAMSNSGVAMSIGSNSNNNTLLNNTVISNSSYGIQFYLSSNNTLRYNNLTGSYGFGLDKSINNIDFTNILDGSYQLYYNYSISNYIFDLNSAPNVGGVCCINCTNITVRNLNLSHHNGAGVYFIVTTNSTIQNITSSSNYQGIYLSASSNNTISNSISSNNFYGIDFSYSNRTVVTNLTAKNNSLYGIYLESGSYFNILTNSFIQLSNSSAFAMIHTGIPPQNNSFYNNYFNNSVQYYNLSSSSLNYFNTTKTAGTNIVGGNFLAGNYWAAPDGTGFSQTCTSSTDGICDTAYNFDGVNFDYLPLACVEHWSCGDWAGCSGNVQKRICIDSNLCQTYKFKPSESQVCDSGGHVAQSQGGAGGATFTQPLTDITPIQPVQIIINNSEMDLNSLTINVKNSVSNTSVNITTVNQTESGLPIGKLYQAFEINPGIDNSNIINATLNFKIDKTWLEENNITFHSKGNRSWLVQNDIVGNIILYRNPEGAVAWLPLVTTFSSEDNQYYYFSAYSPGFSTFAIFLNRYDCLPNSARCDNNEVQLCVGNSTWLVTDHCSDTCGNGKCTSSFFKSDQFYFLIITFVVALIAIVTIILFTTIGKNKYKPYSKF